MMIEPRCGDVFQVRIERLRLQQSGRVRMERSRRALLSEGKRTREGASRQDASRRRSILSPRLAFSPWLFEAFLLRK